jgi:hypothetical protein
MKAMVQLPEKEAVAIAARHRPDIVVLVARGSDPHEIEESWRIVREMLTMDAGPHFVTVQSIEHVPTYLRLWPERRARMTIILSARTGIAAEDLHFACPTSVIAEP